MLDAQKTINARKGITIVLPDPDSPLNCRSSQKTINARKGITIHRAAGQATRRFPLLDSENNKCPQGHYDLFVRYNGAAIHLSHPSQKTINARKGITTNRAPAVGALMLETGISENNKCPQGPCRSAPKSRR
jgi:hypothetical protein